MQLQNPGNTSFPITPLFSFPLIYLSLSAEKCALSSYPWLPVPRGGISSLHLFEGFLIWGLGQTRSSVPSSIIPGEEQREGEEEVEKRRKSKGDGVISYLSSHSSHLQPLSLSVHLSLAVSIFLTFLSLRSFSSHLLSQRQPVAPAIPTVCPSVHLSVCPIV